MVQELQLDQVDHEVLHKEVEPSGKKELNLMSLNRQREDDDQIQLLRCPTHSSIGDHFVCLCHNHVLERKYTGFHQW